MEAAKDVAFPGIIPWFGHGELTLTSHLGCLIIRYFYSFVGLPPHVDCFILGSCKGAYDTRVQDSMGKVEVWTPCNEAIEVLVKVGVSSHSVVIVACRVVSLN